MEYNRRQGYFRFQFSNLGEICRPAKMIKWYGWTSWSYGLTDGFAKQAFALLASPVANVRTVLKIGHPIRIE